MEDWLGIILGILVIIGPALFDKKNRKKKDGKRSRPPYMESPEMTEVQQPDTGPVYVPVSSEEQVPVSEEIVLQDGPAVVQQPVRQTMDTVSVRNEVETACGVNAPVRRKRRFNGRDMIVYSEIMKPKF